MRVAKSCTLKIRGGANTYVKWDGSIGTAGKGSLVQWERSGTLGVTQDQTLFVWMTNEETQQISSVWKETEHDLHTGAMGGR